VQWRARGDVRHTESIYPRPLSPRERDVLDRLFAEDFDGRDAFAAQLDATEVTAGCSDCPCPSVELRVDAARSNVGPHDPNVMGHRPLPVQASAPGCDLIVFHHKGWLAYLDCAVHDPDEARSALPTPEELDVYTLPIPH
jgi:hypothetical protein